MTEDGADVVEQGGRRIFPSLNRPPLNWRPPRGAVILLAVGLVIGLAAGYAAGYRQAPRNASAPTASASPAQPVPPPAPQLVIQGTAIQGNGSVFADGLALTQGTTCFAQAGRELQLGVQVTNTSTEPVGLRRVRAVFPLSGFRVISQQWGSCGATGAVQVPVILEPGDSTWLSVTVQVLVACPAPLPVQFAVSYTYAGQAAAVTLPGFVDLSQVPYTGCRTG